MEYQIKPNFFLAGAAKSGTTSMYNYLKAHPDIFFPENKEPKYFAFKGKKIDYNGTKKAVEQIKTSTITNERDYLELFDNAKGFRIIGDASPIYLHDPESAANIYEFNSEAKFLFILRNPVDRLISDWRHQVNMGYEPYRDIEKAVAAWDNERSKINYIPYLNYIPKGFYFKHVKRFVELFGNERILILTYEQFSNETQKSLDKIITFLNIPDFTFDIARIYMKGQPVLKNKNYKQILNLFKNSFFENRILTLLESNPKKSRRLIRELYEYYEKDMNNLARQFNIDISAWKYENYIKS